MLMFGIVITILGAILPSVIEKSGIDKTNAGSLMLPMSFGILLGSLVLGPIVDRFDVPFLLWLFSDYLSYEFIIAGVGLIVIFPLLFFLLLHFPDPKQAQGFPIKQGVGLLKELTLILFGVILFFQSGIEFTVGGWAALFFKEELAIDATKAVLFLSFYWLGMVMVRLLLGYLLKILSPVNIQFSSIMIALIGALTMLLSHNLTLSVLGLFLIGCGFAAAFPVMLGYVGDFYAKLSGTAFSIVFVMALIGGMLFPYFTGVVGQLSSLRLSFIVVPFSLCCIAILFWNILKRIAMTKSTQ